MRAVFFLIVIAFAIGLALFAGRQVQKGDPRAFFVARGRFGALLFFFVFVGETYSIGSMLGFPGGIAAQGRVDVALWFTAYILLAFPIGYLLYPRLWRLGQECGAITLPDLLGRYHGSVLLERMSGALLLGLMLPLGTMQFIGLTDALSRLGLPLPPFLLALLSAGVALVFVMGAGMRGAAMTAMLKDGLVVLIILGVALAAMLHWTGHVPGHIPGQAITGGEQRTALFRFRQAPHPVPSCIAILTIILVQAPGFCIAPQTVAALFSARDPHTIRRAQIWMPLYLLLFPFLLVIAMFGLAHPSAMQRPDQVFLTVATRLLPDWAVGLVLGGVALTALVWLGGVCLSLGAIVARNILPDVPQERQRRTGLVVIVLYLVLSVLTSLSPGLLIVTLNRLFYVGLIQLLPATLLCVMGRRTASLPILCGIGAGILGGLALSFAPMALGGVTPALPALMANVLVLVAIMKTASRA
ncbi:SLC5/6 family protein [Swaminathania salitolerans]|uniref:Sodium:solute symporter n=1 Tax=Swaminathania salitolerans TaxID=182838 RepID=A0A511BLC6_9PROT|nr:sodium:solute symporter [Swaminathania salitolerans]GBQ10061.1 Na+/solute symporter [Swaminathania salitolerans LMG 21291]GEL01149.1 hypothetical protein SSA02_03120 [Swaminathania salitolerans]